MNWLWFLVFRHFNGKRLNSTSHNVIYVYMRYSVI